jgi:hypothetical protein
VPCRQRFYDGDELYKHMEGRHEHCFICRRRDPNKFVYYKDYAELEGEQPYFDIGVDVEVGRMI